VFGDLPTVNAVCADRGYSGTFVEHVAGVWDEEVHINGRSGKGFGFESQRGLAEMIFSRFIGQRRLSKDFEKTTASSESMIYVAATARSLREIAFN
jgi:hypothetical protein